MNDLSIASLLLLYWASGCSSDAQSYGAEVEDAGDFDAYNAATPNDVVLLDGGCTGTLIVSNIVLAAAHCGFGDRGFVDGSWHPLLRPVRVLFGPNRSARVYSATAARVKTAPLAPVPWPESMAFFELTERIPPSIAIPNSMYLQNSAAAALDPVTVTVRESQD
jgi:hypothetical protein